MPELFGFTAAQVENFCVYNIQTYRQFLHFFSQPVPAVCAAEAIDASIAGLDGRTLPTYDLNCGATDNSLSEDFSETVGNTVRINVFGHCASLIVSMYPDAATRYEDFWTDFSEHRNYVQEVTFN